jgi:hypothetical protein
VAASGITCWAMVKAVPSSGVSNSAVIAIVIARVPVVSRVPIATAAIVPAAAVVSAAAPISVVPGAGADKETTHEPARSVVAIGRAGVWVIRIVAPGTDRSRVSVTIVSVSVSAIPDTDTDTYLSVGGSRHQRYGDHCS